MYSDGTCIVHSNMLCILELSAMQMSHKPLKVLRKLQGRLPSIMFEGQPLDLFTDTNDISKGHVVFFMFFIILVTFLFFFLNQLTILDCNLALHQCRVAKVQFRADTKNQNWQNQTDGSVQFRFSLATWFWFLVQDLGLL